MADIKALVRKVRQDIKMRPVLPVGQTIGIGSVGYIEDDAFRYVGTVSTMLQQGPGDPVSGNPVPIVSITSGRDVQLFFHAAGQTSETFGSIANGRARIEVTFSNDKSFLLAAESVTPTTMAEPHLLLQAMLRAYKAGAWQERYCFVYQVGVAATFTIALSEQAASKLLISGNAALGDGPATVGKLAAGVKFERASGATTVQVGEANICAFFNAYRVKDRVFRKLTTEVASAALGSTDAEELPRKLGIKGSPFELA